MFWLPSLQLIQDSVKHNILVYDVGDIDFRDIINVDIEGLFYKIKDELLEHKEDFMTGDEYYTRIDE